jgi:hypothetical protein
LCRYTTEPSQDSYGQDNHVYDSGHIFDDREMWQRTFGETVAPKLDNTCSGIRSGKWRNRLYKPAQQFISQSFVFGTCAKHCGEVAATGAAYVHAARLGAAPGSAFANQTRRDVGEKKAEDSDSDSISSLGAQTRTQTKSYRAAGGATGEAEAFDRAAVFKPSMPVLLAAAAACVAAAVMLAGAAIERRWFGGGKSSAAAAERISLLNAA